MRVVKQLAVVVGLSLGALAQAAPVSVKQVQEWTSGGLVRGWVATVDLTDPTVEVIVTERTGGANAEATLTRTDVWRTQVGAQLAINANFYASLGGGLADIVGLSVTDGQIVSPVRTFNGVPDPAAVIPPGGPMRVGQIGGLNAGEQTADAVAGVGPSTTDTDPGTLLVDDGMNLGATARVQPGVRNPRTAIGTTQDGTTLIIAVIDGRQAGWSVGMTLPELADLMIREGAWDAINLDGGGSSSFIYESPTGDVVQNRPSDGSFRAVANHLGVRTVQPAVLPDNVRRPIRGVWLRPPNSSQVTFESYVQTLASYGITDLFLETFYWGLATHDSDVFNDRFGYDYLKMAIRIGAKYGVRVHAWLEAGYWSFSGTGNYLFAQNPDIAVVNNVNPSLTGDIAGQVFVNLGNPWVQDKLYDLCAELSEYPGLWGIQTDYHRFPANAGNNQAPWSYDNWARTEFQAIYGVDPLISAAGPGSPFWTQWTEFRRAGVSQAANVMHQAINASTNPGIAFSAAIFASAMTSASQFSKMQNWPEWAENGYIEWIVPMAYSTSTTGIRNDIQTTQASAFGRRIVAGLAILTNTTRPSVAQQLATIQGRGVEDFILFDAPTLLANPTMQQELATWINSSATRQLADINNDRWVDARDIAQWDNFYPGSPVNVNGLNAGFNLNGDSVIDLADRELLIDAFRAFRFGEDGEVDALDLAILIESMTGPGPGGAPVYPLNLFDLDADNDVDYDDQLILHSLKTRPIPFELDVSVDGLVDVEDLHHQVRTPRDVNRDGVIDQADYDDLEQAVRGNDLADMESNNPS